MTNNYYLASFLTKYTHQVSTIAKNIVLHRDLETEIKSN